MNQRQKIVQEQFINNEEAVIKRLKSVYKQSLKDIEGKALELQNAINSLDLAISVTEDAEELARLQSMKQAKVYQKQYQDALKKQVGSILDNMQVEEFKTVSEYLQKCYEDGFIGTMYDLQGQGIPLCFPLDQESMVRAVQLDSKISQGLYSRLGEDVSLLKKKITAQVSRGIATGMSFALVAKQLEGYTNIGFNNAVRIARTEGHRIQTQATMDACYKAKDRGADIVKQWDSTLDAKTRDSHARVDGEIRELDKKFSNDLMFPCDPSGGAAEVVNCRCALLQRARWALEGSFTKMNNFTKQIETFESPEDYAEFKKAFFSKENRQFMNYHTELEERYDTKNFEKLLGSMTDAEYKHWQKLYNSSPIYNKAAEKGGTAAEYNKLKAKGVLTKNTRSGKIQPKTDNLKPFTKVKVEDIPSMDEHRFNIMKRNLERKGVAVIQDAEGDAYLKYMGAEAMTLSDGSAVIFQSGRVPSASAAFEEIIHSTQIKLKGMVESTGDERGNIEYLNREIEANEKLLKYKKAYRLTDKDIESVEENLEMYYKKLKEVKKNV